MQLRIDTSTALPGRAGLLVVLICLVANARAADAPGVALDEKVAAALAMPFDRAAGRRQFDRSCTDCHGSGGRGDAAHRVPVLAGQRFKYLVRQMASIATGERHGGAMHNVLSTTALRDPQTWVNVAAYLDAATPPKHPKTGTGEFLGLGEATFRVQCASCHYEDARGRDEGFVPSLRNQHYSYLRGQLNRLASYHPDVDENLARLLKSLRSDERDGLADHLSRLHGLMEVPREAGSAE